MVGMLKQGRSLSGNERNCCFLNLGSGQFATVSAVSGLDFLDDGRAVAVVDWDHDGDLDFWTSNRNAPRIRFLRNDTPSGNHFLALRLVGNRSTTNRDAIGARVEVVVRDLKAGEASGHSPLIKTLRAGEGFLAQSSKWLHFGLGRTQQIESVSVRWPDGTVEKFAGLERNRRYVLKQGVSEEGRLVAGPHSPEMWERPGRIKTFSRATADLPAQSDPARIPLVTLLPVPQTSYVTLDSPSGDSSRRPLPLGEDRFVLVNLWASWCRPCRVELKEFTEREAELRAAGIEILALSVDGLGDNRSDAELAHDVLSELEFPFNAGVATPELLQTMNDLYHRLSPLWRPLPLPSSFLIDRSGHLAVIYKGPLSTDDLIQDATQTQRTRQQRREHAAQLDGRAIAHEVVAHSMDSDEAKTRFDFARDLQAAGHAQDAVVQYREVLKIDGDFVEAHNNLGAAFTKIGDIEGARRHYETALQLNPAHANSHFNLGLQLYRLGKLDEARTHYERALEINPEFADACQRLGSLFLRKGELSHAREYLERALRIDPNDPEALHFLGTVSLNEGNLAEASSLFQRALKIRPNLAQAHNNLGTVFVRQGQLVQAAESFRRAIRANPDYVDPCVNLGIVLFTQGKLYEAEAQLERALEFKPGIAAAQKRLQQIRAALEKDPRGKSSP